MKKRSERYRGKLCASHPEQEGERRHGDCVACERARARLRSRRRYATTSAQYHSLTAIERAQWFEFYDLARARTAQTGVRWEVDHDTPLARGGRGHPSNFVLLPAAMNAAKCAAFGSTWEFLTS